MTSEWVPVVEFPFPRSSQPFQLQQEVLALVRQAPVLRAQLPDGTGGWLVTGFDEARQVLVDQRFSRAQAVSKEQSKRGIEVLAANSLIAMDPPEHTRLRKPIASAFTARRMRQIRPRVASIVAELLDALVAGPRPADLVSSFSLPLPVRVICELLGVPPADQDKFHAWSDVLMGDWDRDFDEMMAALTAMGTFIMALIAGKRAAPTDDLISALVTASDDAGRLSDIEVIQLCILILIGGHETTANQINMSLLTLLSEPAELARLRADPGLLPGAVEEFMRYVQLGGGAPPARIATQDVPLGGVTIPAGDAVWPLMAFANRDPSNFPDPDRLDLGRDARGHLGFGAGAHHCLGAQLARIELQEAFRGLLSRLPGLRLAVPMSELRYKEKMVVNSVVELPVTWDG